MLKILLNAFYILLKFKLYSQLLNSDIIHIIPQLHIHIMESYSYIDFEVVIYSCVVLENANF